MNLDSDVLRRLYECLILQDPYPGQTCPAEYVLVAHARGALHSGLSQLVEQHLHQCPSCIEDLEELRKAMEWFHQNERWILMGLAAKGAAAGALPWAKCPSSQLLYRYANKQIPVSDGGKVLLAEIQEHLTRCPDCIRLCEELRAGVEGQHVSIADLGARAGGAVRNWLSGFADALLAAAQAAGSPSFVRAAPGYRSGESPTVDAVLVDRDGCLVVDEQGQPATCCFQVLEANVKEDGFLTLDLVTADSEFHPGERGDCDARAAITVNGKCLDLSSMPIDEQGRVTFTGLVPETSAVDPLPLALLDVTVVRMDD